MDIYDIYNKTTHCDDLSFHLAPGMTLSTVKDAIFNLVHLIYVGSCYYNQNVFTVSNIPFRHELKNIFCNKLFCWYMWNYLYIFSYIYGVFKMFVRYNFKVEIRDVYIFDIPWFISILICLRVQIR
jgi:hypothetical protein